LGDTATEQPGPVLVLDTETQQAFSEVGGKHHLHRLKVSVACVYNYETGSYSSFFEQDLDKLDALLRLAGLVVGFNVRRFDLGVLKPYLLGPVGDIPVLDLLEEIEQVRGHRVGLESIAEATFQQRKSGSGLDAVRLYREGRIQELTDYCLNDVRLTKDIYEYGNEHGKVYFRSIKDHRIHEIPVAWNRIRPKKRSSASRFPTGLF